MKKKFDVVIIGAGPAGLSAAMYLAKAEVSAVVIGDGRTLMKSAYLDHTYLGLEEGITGEDFLQQAAQQVRNMGVALVDARVSSVQETEHGFAVVTEEDTYLGESVILAAGVSHDTPVLASLEMEDNDEPYIKQRVKVDSRGRTSKRGIYAAGVAAGTASQAIIAAGHGAQVALNLLSDLSERRVCIHDKKPVVAAK